MRRFVSLLSSILFSILAVFPALPPVSAEGGGFIKWVDFNVSYPALRSAMELDIQAHEEGWRANWTEMLACLGAKYGGNFKQYKEKDLQALYGRLRKGEAISEITSKYKQYGYYREAYDAVLGGLVGRYRLRGEDGQWVEHYGLRGFSPIAAGFPYSHYDDFGAGRSYGYKRRHLGHDMMGQVGTPVVAAESGRVEVMGWNQYGGWRVGIRSLDGRRYYYYAHLRKNRPFHVDLAEGKIVDAGDIIGYMGRTGYSRKENVNNIEVSHLHFGLQLIFDESQKECDNEIWVDVYPLTKLLSHNRSAVYRVPETKEFYRKTEFESID